AAWWAMEIGNPAGRRFRALAALYVALILCVSGTSFFAFKTSALLGFLLGCGAAASGGSSTPAARPGSLASAPSLGRRGAVLRETPSSSPSRGEGVHCSGSAAGEGVP